MLKLPDYVQKFMNTFHEKGFEIYVVGGAVRELLLGNQVDNWDFATNAKPEEILKIFPDGFYNNQFGTVGIEVIGHPELVSGSIFEVTTYRHEGKYEDARHPSELQWAKTIEEDLSRRDFTINAIALSDGELVEPESKGNYKLIDPYDGQKNLKEKLIVAVGDPDKRFSEDALRLMRAIRFASELGFLIEDKTKESIKKNAELITKISWERVRDELLKIIVSDNPAEGVLFLRNSHLLHYILPEVDDCFEIPQKSPKRHHVYDVGTHLVMALKHCPSKDPVTRLATLLHDIGKKDTFRKNDKTGMITFYNHEVVGTKQTEKIADRLKLSKKQKEKLVTLVKNHQFTVTEIMTDNTIRRFIRNVGKEYLQDILDLRTGDRIGSGAKPSSWRFELFKKRLEEVQVQPFKITDLKINGEDVMKELKLKPGPQIGKILNNLFTDVTEDKLENKKEVLIKKIRSLPKIS